MKILYSSALSLMILGSALGLSIPAQAELTINNDQGMAALKIDSRQTPSDASIIKLMQVLRVDEMVQQSLGAQNDMIGPLMSGLMDEKQLEGMTAAKRTQIIDLVTDMTQKLIADTSTDVVRISHDNFLDLAKKHYTQAEVDAQINFYSSDIGQSIMDKQAPFMQEYMQRIMPETMDIMNSYMKIALPKLEQQIEAITD